MSSFIARLLFTTLVATAISAAEPIRLWPNGAPGEKGGGPAEADVTKPTDGGAAGKPVIRLSNVTDPTLTFFPAPADHNSGASVIVCPGGGYGILAYNLEGTEICEWLNSIGVNAVLLKYRVPVRYNRARYEAPLQDAQRALGLVRQHAVDWKLDPKRVGIMGFSAGGHLSAAASTNYETRTYPTVDAADALSCRPDFTLLIYPAYLTAKDDLAKLAPEIKVSAQTPPAFVLMTQDDGIGVENAMTYSLALKNVKVPCELHIFPVGGHGYGLRKPHAPVVTQWPLLAAEWLKNQKLITP